MSSRDRLPGRLIVLCAALSAFGPLSMDAYLPALPSLGRGLEASASAVGATLTACVIGIAVGQLVLGPISDFLGRRRPLLAGLAVYTGASLLCAVAPNIWLLILFRLLQGIGGAAGIVIARAVARDRYSGATLVRFMGLMLAVMNVTPILAPIIGAALLHVTSWRGIFVALAIVVAAMFVATSLWLPETLAPEDRHSPGLGQTFRLFGHHLGNRVFVGYCFSGAFAFGAMFAYITASPFVLEDIHGLSPQQFSIVFAANALGLMAMARLSAHLVHRAKPRTLVAVGITASATGCVGVLVSTLAGAGLAPLLVSFFLVVASLGLVGPSSQALALSGDPRTAGSASALLGASQFVIGAVVAPLVGLAGSQSAVPLAIVMVACGAASLLTFATLTRERVTIAA
jgi:DHA1 family bicyclomycin/chloramphenicol resistance-like MFS transporter